MEIRDLLQNLHLIEIRTRKKMQGGLASSYRNVFRGQGLEFAEVREYVEGDDIRLIDWNVSARMPNLYVKQLMEERELNVVVALQCSRSMDYGTGAKTKYQAAAEVAAYLIFSAIHTGDRSGLLLFGGGPLEYVPPGKGIHHGFIHLHRIIERALIHPEVDSAGLLRFLTHGLKKRSVVFLVGDLIYSDWSMEMVEIAARRHDLICIGILDPTESGGPPPGIYPFAGETGKNRDVSCPAPTLRNYARIARRHQDNFTTRFQQAGADVLFLDSGSTCEHELHRLFMSRLHT